MIFEPMTAREALLEIRRQIAGYETMEDIDALCVVGLDRTAPPDFELTDHLADRLAEAHEVLRVFATRRNGERENRRVAEALALPPDLEAMVERRIGPR